MTVAQVNARVWKELGEEYREGYMLHEVILKERLERPMHYSEVVMDSIIKWSSWSDEDRKHNFLVLKIISEQYKDSLELAKPPFTLSGEVHYSTNCNSSPIPLLFNKSDVKKLDFRVVLWVPLKNCIFGMLTGQATHLNFRILFLPANIK